MTTLVLEGEPAITNVLVTEGQFTITLADGRELIVPLDWYPRLVHATAQERSNWRILGDGYAIEWPELDEFIGIEGLLAGRRSGESETSLQNWLASRQ
jgi:hypothetical protein